MNVCRCAGCDTVVLLADAPKADDLVLCGQCECECMMALGHEDSGVRWDDIAHQIEIYNR